MSSLVMLSHLTRATSRRMLMTRSLHTSIRTSALPVTRSIVSLTQASHLPCLCSAMARTRITSSPSHTSRRHFASATDASVKRENVRNFAIIAHVDHGKTTLVDGLLRQSITHISSEATCVMDSNQLEKERGITILAKCTSVLWKAPTTGENYQLNIVDTPGHADFGGEVERIMSMVDGVCLVVDATDGPMTQTKFVLSKALAKGLRPIVVINKVDRPTARVGDVENEIFDLFVSLNATDEQMDFPIVYASGKNGWSHLTPKETGTNMNPLFETCIRHIPAPQVDVNAPFSMLVTQIDSHPFFGKLLVGRVQTGTVKTGDAVHAIDPEGKKLEAIKIIKILSRRGLEQIIVDDAQAGDIIALAGFGAATVNSTLCDTKVTKPIPSTPIDPPTVSMTFSPNDSPFGGKEGKYLTSGAIGERLKKEAESNVSLKVMPSTVSADAYDVHGRGELQLGILIETMRRESYELSVSPPRVVMKKEPNGKTLEPMEEVILDCDQEHSGQVIEKLANRKGEMVDFINMEGGGARLIFRIPMRGLIGYRAEFQNDTSGQGQLNHIFHSYVEYKGEIERNKNGSLVSMSEGVVTAFALDGLESRGILFIAPGDKVYNGQVVGEHAKETDLEVNAAKTKMLTNVRSTVKEDKTRLSPPKIMSLEEMIAYCRDDEVIEVTPTALRLRKRILDQGERDKAMRAKKQAREREREAEKANRSSA